jgi:hypothetical protein
MRKKLAATVIMLVVLFGLALAGCGPQKERPNRIETQTFLLVGVMYEIRGQNFEVVDSQFCFLWDEVCMGNPWGFAPSALPEGLPIPEE